MLVVCLDSATTAFCTFLFVGSVRCVYETATTTTTTRFAFARVDLVLVGAEGVARNVTWLGGCQRAGAGENRT